MEETRRNFCLVPVSLGLISKQLGFVAMEAASSSEAGTDAILGSSQICFLLVVEYCSGAGPEGC